MRKLDLSGFWHAELFPLEGEPYSARISLPGTTSFSGIGPENRQCDAGHLTELHPFEGTVCYAREVSLPEHSESLCLLTLERTRISEVFWDGERIGRQDSLCAPHRYLLPNHSPGLHRLEIRISNTGYPVPGGHMTSPDTQTNWNGIVGEMSLTLADALAASVQILPDTHLGRIRVCAEITGKTGDAWEASILAYDQKEEAASLVLPVYAVVRDGHLEFEFENALCLPCWDEARPNVLKLRLTCGGDSFFFPFGFRSFRAEGRRLKNNGHEVFLRGMHDGLLFPQTGFAPMNLESWLRFMRTVKAYGLNHIRYHTSCPPEAAFLAADLTGVWMEPELPFWGTVREEGEAQYDPAERDYLDQEALRILRAFGHHPSFVMLSMGNELWGSKKILNRRMRACRELNPDKLYISGSNNFQFTPDVLAEEDVFCGVRFGKNRLIRGSYAMCDAPQGLVQTVPPESVSSFDEAIDPGTEAESGAKAEGNASEASRDIQIQFGTEMKVVQGKNTGGGLICPKPILSHEVGQYACYPDFSEESHYQGPLRPRYLNVFRKRLEKAGLWAEHERFFRCSGALAAACYRREIETALRTRELAGFQLLDLKDFTGQGVALVGMLNGLMENKGLISPEAWRAFCSDTVALGLFDKFVFRCGEPLVLGAAVSCSRGERVPAWMKVEFFSSCGTETRMIPKPAGASSRYQVWEKQLSFGSVHCEKAEQAHVRLTLDTGEENEYALWLLPDSQVEITEEGIRDGSRFLAFLPETEGAEAEQRVASAVYIPSAKGKLPAEYCTDFWNYTMFASISRSMGKPEPVGTLGLCIDTASPLLHGFPTAEYTTPQWDAILRTAHCEPLPPEICPAVQMIDNVERCQRLGILYEKDGKIHLTARLWENPKDPAVQAFAAALLDALAE